MPKYNILHKNHTMPTEIKCPKCGFGFPMEEAVSEEYKRDLREKMEMYKRQKDEELKKHRDDLEVKEKQFREQLSKSEEDLHKRMAEEKARLRESLEAELRKSVAGDYENRLKLLQEANTQNDEKLREARKKELEYLRKEQELLAKEEQMNITLQKQLLEERKRLSEQIRKEEIEKQSFRDTEWQLKMKELEKQLDDQRKLAEEMKRRSEQGSMQLQGEVQELILEEMLRADFPFDLVCEVGKGVRGADCLLTVRNTIGQECGKIIFESKRTKHFDKGWIEKLKADMRATASDIGVIVTQAKPDQMEKFGQIEGIWICSFSEVSALVHVLREGIIKIFNALKAQENRGDKMHMLYGYLTSHEFAEQWNAIREGFQAMKLSIQKERDAMERLWKAREKQLEKVLLNAAHIKGSIEGISGQDSINLNLLEGTTGDDI